MLWFFSWMFTSAHAGPVVHKFCLEFNNLSYTDGSTGDFHTGSSIKARGVQFKIKNTATGTVYTPYSDWEGPDRGCVELVLESTQLHQVSFLYRSYVNDNYVSVNNPTGVLYASPVIGTYFGGGTRYLTHSATDRVHVLSSLIMAMKRHNGGVTGKTISWRTDPDFDGLAAWHHSLGAVVSDLSDNATHRKFVHSHELGHGLGDHINGMQGANKSYDSPMNQCSQAYFDADGNPYSHRMNSKEHQSAAAVEGFAHFYSAVSWNASGTSSSECEMENHHSFDWNANGSFEPDEDGTTLFRCDQSFNVGASITVDGADYLEDECLDQGVTVHRGTELDWLRTFWDLRTASGWDVDDVFSVWNWANPHNWNATWDGPTADDVWKRMQNSADALGLGTDYSTQAANNGTDR